MSTVANKTPVKADAKEGAPRSTSPISAEVKNLSALIENVIQIDAKTGIATVPTDTYERLLPEGLTKETIVQLNAHNAQIAAAATLAVGNTAIPVMTKHKDLDRVEFEMPTFGKDKFAVTFDRSRQVPDRSDGNTGGVRQQFGASRTSFEMYGTESRGELKKVKQELMSSAADAFAKMGK